MELSENAKAFDSIVNHRRATRLYDRKANFDEGAVVRSLERALLAPSSSNMQLSEFYRVKTSEKKEELADYCMAQASAKTANELIAIVIRPDKWKERQQFLVKALRESFGDKIGKKEQSTLDYYEKLIPTLYMNDPFGVSSLIKKISSSILGMNKPTPREITATDVRIIAHKSAALAAQTFMLSMAAEGYDTCPMEGFDSERAKKLLNLPSAAEITMIVSVGKRSPKGIIGQRVRLKPEEVIFTI